MAEVVSLVCDAHRIENGEHVPATTTKRFTVDGKDFIVDLCDDDAADYERDMERWTARGQRAKKSTRGKGKAAVSAAVTGPVSLRATRTELPWYRQQPGDGRKANRHKQGYRQKVRHWAQQQPQWSDLGNFGIVPAEAFEAFARECPDEARGDEERFSQESATW